MLPIGLHLVATPIGNLADITLRALDVLGRADIIACEDTRVTRKLLARHAIAGRKLLAYHEHNSERMRPALMGLLEAGKIVALVSDAGMPLVSDPGYKLVRACVDAGIPVTAAPGANAALTALVLSGLPSDRFLFAGFLPPRSAARRQVLHELASVPATLIFYEGVSRLPQALADMAAMLGPRPAAVARELTKLFEEVRRDTLPALAAHYAAEGAPRGEVVVVVGAPDSAVTSPPSPHDVAASLDALLTEALARLSPKAAVAEVAAQTGLPRRQVYARALALTEPGKTR